MLECPVCKSDELELVERLPDDRRKIRCSSCHHTWLRGEAKRVTETPASYAGLRDRFPDRASVDPSRMAVVEEWKSVFLLDHPTPGGTEYLGRTGQDIALRLVRRAFRNRLPTTG